MRNLLSEHDGKNRHLARQLIRIILGLYFFVALLVTCIQITLELNNEKDRLQQQISALAKTFHPSASEAMWNYDDTQIQANLKGIYQNEEVYGAELSNGSDQYYGIGLIINQQGERVLLNLEDNTVSQQPSEGFYDLLYQSKHPLISPNDDNEIIGHMTLYYSSKTMVQRTYLSLMLTVSSAFIKTLFLAFISVTVIHTLIGKPISELKEKINQFDIDSAEKVTFSMPSEEEIRKGNELFLLQQTITALCCELENRNFAINQHTNELEKKVQDRTRELDDSMRELLRLDQVKSDFLAKMSHELRTPLNSIIGFSKRISTSRKPVTDEKAREISAIILRCGQNLAEMINMILDFSQLESGKLELELSHLPADDFISNIVEEFTPKAEQKNLSLQHHIDHIDTIYADPNQLRQVLHNLISNAIKFTSQGQIDIYCFQKKNNDVEGTAISIQDTGVGIAEQDLPKLFIQFEQIGESSLNTTPGAGLGLAMVHKIMNLHKGTVSAISSQDNGSTFTLWFPNQVT